MTTSIVPLKLVNNMTERLKTTKEIINPATMPVNERLAGAADFLRLRDFSPMQALELRLDQVRQR